MIFSDLSGQWVELSAGVFCGMVSGLYYELFFVLRRLFKAKGPFEFALDLLFCLLSIATLFVVLYAVNGMDFKWYVLLGFLVGFWLERASFAKPVATCTDKLYNMLKKAIAALQRRRKRVDGKTADVQD
ncbi:MAG: hypothetical protein GX304_02680 [Clostridiales bacterium]|jgi:hypothetical protein|nr:hypothetical protein [Clostridiales bacterium]